MWFIGVEVEQETSAPAPKKNSWIRPCAKGDVTRDDGLFDPNVLAVVYICFIKNNAKAVKSQIVC